MENTPLSTLFSSEIGLLSVFTIGFVMCMAVYIYFYVRKQIKHDTEANQGKD
ncbi:DUF3149 domain-containing protein [Chitinibacter fontanus]|uniref:DUF3149 domain-containing protein n=1 Tax=Chitinibacter fontanus TaxID=1737446 RepID=A0A7D5ZIL5_9NEIS|nr:DUF3149 domain-containing protein [Chitinibacter fontanus]QLI82467.1 DUF3149 domain-containing protein [Chitinibacter fontanus]